MAAPQKKIDWQSEEAPRGPVVAGQMPARALQQELTKQIGILAEPHVDRWSQRRALTFIATSAFALWAALIVSAHTVMTAVA